MAELDVHRDCGIEQLGSASYLNTDGSLTMTQSSADNAVARAIWSSRQLCHSRPLTVGSGSRRFRVCVCDFDFLRKGWMKEFRARFIGAWLVPISCVT